MHFVKILGSDKLKASRMAASNHANLTSFIQENKMSTSKYIPLPQDNELPQETVNLLKNLPPLNIHRLLTLAPNTHQPWLDFVAGIYKGAFDPRLREIAICRYGFKTNSSYELHQHKALARKVGISSQELEIICTEQNVVSLSDEENFICQVVD